MLRFARVVPSAATLAVLVAACSGGADTASDTTAPATRASTAAPVETAVATTAPETTAIASTTTESTLPPPTEQRLVATGPEEMVFDWSEDRCDDGTYPDIAPRVVRNAEGLVQLYIGNDTTYRMTGPDLNTLTIDCAATVMTSDYESDPAQFNDWEWISSTYTPDGQTVYAIVHNEYLGTEHADVLPDQCPSGVTFDCIDVSLTMAISTDGGATYDHAFEPPNHLIATMPYVFDDEGVASGLWQTSNIVEGPDGLFYVLVNIATTEATARDVGVQWVCAMRTADLTDPTSWRFWDGEEFAGQFVNPYTQDASDTDVCAPVDFPALQAEMSESILWDESIERFVIVGGTHELGAQTTWGTYYSTSEDLIDWTPRQLLLENEVPRTVADQAEMTFIAYPTLLDPDSPSANFATTDGSMYLYLVRFNAGGVSLDRDLVRIPVAWEEVTYEPTVWEFDTDGDAPLATGGWTPLFDIGEFEVADGALSMTSTGNDPYMANYALRIPAQFDTVSITMAADAVDAGGGQTAAELFFWTDGVDVFDESRLKVFDVIADGEMRTYDLDMSTVDTWDGFITALRIDPAGREQLPITIERIEVS
ncbi:MAG: hypothetical protein AAFY28_18470 [Actinomycetota bacterium]